MTNREYIESLSDEELAEHNIVNHIKDGVGYYMTSDDTKFEFDGSYIGRELKWKVALAHEIEWLKSKAKIEISEDEKAILRNLPKNFLYIARDENGKLYLYESKPVKIMNQWETTSCGYRKIDIFDHLFQCVQWSDEEPTLIADLLNS